MTLYALGEIRPNPFRNIDRYPINREKVEKLKESIGRTDFWDNLVARLAADGKPEIGYGHHRMVALREMFPPEHEIGLIVRDLDDAAMLHVMADENMQEWSASSGVIVETVRAVRDFLRGATEKGSTNGGRPSEPTSASAVAAFLGWPPGRVEAAISILNSEEAGLLDPDDTAGLDLEHASVLRRQVTKIANPVLRKQAIARVHEDVREGRVGYRGIPDVVRAVRDEAAPPPAPKVPAAIAKAIYSDLDNFWRVAVPVNGRSFTRSQIIRLIAENRDAAELVETTYGAPWAEQIAIALDAMAEEAHRLSEVLRAESAVEIAS